MPGSGGHSTSCPGAPAQVLGGRPGSAPPCGVEQWPEQMLPPRIAARCGDPLLQAPALPKAPLQSDPRCAAGLSSVLPGPASFVCPPLPSFPRARGPSPCSDRRRGAAALQGGPGSGGGEELRGSGRAARLSHSPAGQRALWVSGCGPRPRQPQSEAQEVASSQPAPGSHKMLGVTRGFPGASGCPSPLGSSRPWRESGADAVEDQSAGGSGRGWAVASPCLPREAPSWAVPWHWLGVGFSV